MSLTYMSLSYSVAHTHVSRTHGSLTTYTCLSHTSLSHHIHMSLTHMSLTRISLQHVSLPHMSLPHMSLTHISLATPTRLIYILPLPPHTHRRSIRVCQLHSLPWWGGGVWGGGQDPPHTSRQRHLRVGRGGGRCGRGCWGGNRRAWGVSNECEGTQSQNDIPVQLVQLVAENALDLFLRFWNNWLVSNFSPQIRSGVAIQSLYIWFLRLFHYYTIAIYAILQIYRNSTYVSAILHIYPIEKGIVEWAIEKGMGYII